MTGLFLGHIPRGCPENTCSILSTFRPTSIPYPKLGLKRTLLQRYPQSVPPYLFIKATLPLHGSTLIRAAHRAHLHNIISRSGPLESLVGPTRSPIRMRPKPAVRICKLHSFNGTLHHIARAPMYHACFYTLHVGGVVQRALE